MIIDSHAHLDLLDNPEKALERARAADVIHVVTIGVDLESSEIAAQRAKKHPEVSCAVGIHPHEAENAPQNFQNLFLKLAYESNAVAIGEIGLDYFYNHSPKDIQQKVFAQQIELAKKAGLPIVIHSRDAHEDMLAILKEQNAGEVGGVVHCFSADSQIAKKVLDLNFNIGITGTVTFPKNQELRDVVKMAPHDRLMVETDCPYLAPVPKRGKPNEPSYLTYVIEVLAKEMGLSPNEAALKTSQNTARLFGLKLKELKQCTA